MSAWIYQDAKQVKKHGCKTASWYVGWYDPEGRKCCKSCGPGSAGKRAAEKLRQKTDAELVTGTYQSKKRESWEDFRHQYEERVLSGLAVLTRGPAVAALENFERIMHPQRVATICTSHIDDFIARRRGERGKKAGSRLSPASINKDLRHLKAVLRVAKEWGYLATLPKFRMEREPRKLPVYVTVEHFAAMYRACEQARWPIGQPYTPADWWRGLLAMAYMTGWRIGDILALDRSDLDLEAGVAISRAEHNKGKRDERVKLHAAVVEHLKHLAGFHPRVFPWPHGRRALQKEFAKLQEGAGIHLDCSGNHSHTRYCHVYGFHDLRRAFATMNADKLTPDALQALMRHKSYQTTQVYINMARQMDAAVASLHVPDVLKSRHAMEG
jgi:integrase